MGCAGFSKFVDVIGLGLDLFNTALLAFVVVARRGGMVQRNRGSEDLARMVIV